MPTSVTWTTIIQTCAATTTINRTGLVFVVLGIRLFGYLKQCNMGDSPITLFYYLIISAKRSIFFQKPFCIFILLNMKFSNSNISVKPLSNTIFFINNGEKQINLRVKCIINGVLSTSIGVKCTNTGFLSTNNGEKCMGV